MSFDEKELKAVIAFLIGVMIGLAFIVGVAIGRFG